MAVRYHAPEYLIEMDLLLRIPNLANFFFAVHLMEAACNTEESQNLQNKKEGKVLIRHYCSQ